MENFYNELIGFSIVACVILMLAYYTKRKEEQFKEMNNTIKKNKEKKD